MKAHAPARLLSVAALVALAASSLEALGRPDWARPFLNLPTPAGKYIAANDLWAIVYGEVTFSLSPQGRIEETCRLMYENMTDGDRQFSSSLAYDDGQTELADVQLDVQRTLWHSINLERQAVRASVRDSAQLVVVGAEAIAPHKRVVLEYTLRERLSIHPWTTVGVLFPEPAAKLLFRVSDEAAGKLSLSLRSPGSGTPERFTRTSATSWTVVEVPARARVSAGQLYYQPATTDLLPYFAVAQVGIGDDLRTFVASYRAAWAERLAAIDSAAVSARARGLTENADKPLEKIGRLAAFVQSEIQNDASNEKSVESWLPITPAETLRSMKGDCKGKVMLLQALLKQIGIESAPVLLRSDSSYYEWSQGPAGAFFNHVVLAVKVSPQDRPPAQLRDGPVQGWVIFDPVSQAVRFGAPPCGIEGFPALLIADVADPVFTVHTGTPATCYTRVDATWTVSDQDAVGRFEVRDNGASPVLAALTPAAPIENRKELETMVSQAGGDIHLEEARFTGIGRDRDEVRLVATVRQRDPIQNLGERRLVATPVSVAALLAGLPRGLRPSTPLRPEDQIELTPPWNLKENVTGIHTIVEIHAIVELPIGITWTPPIARAEAHPWMTYDERWTNAGERRFTGSIRFEWPRGRFDRAERKERLKLTDELLSALFSPLLATAER